MSGDVITKDEVASDITGTFLTATLLPYRP